MMVYSTRGHPDISVPVVDILTARKQRAAMMANSTEPQDQRDAQKEYAFVEALGWAVDQLRSQTEQQDRARSTAEQKQAETWLRVALAATLLVDEGVKRLPGHWQKTTERQLNSLGFEATPAFLKRNAVELRSALDELNRTARIESTDSPPHDSV